MTKGSLKDKLEGNHLDLSVSGLTTVPVKDIIALRKVTSLDLSNNVLRTLPDDFCLLTQLVKLDLSKNELYELPEHFGSLHNLRHLDLLGNQLSSLPISFCSLSELQWLDLKDNPLSQGLRTASGDCLDDGQCRKSAKQVVVYMKQLQSTMESQRQRLLQQERAEEARRREAAQQEKLAAKQAKKERRRAEYELKQQQQQAAEEAAARAAAESSLSDSLADEKTIGQPSLNAGKHGTAERESSESQRGPTWCSVVVTVFLLAIFALLAMAAVTYLYCDSAANRGSKHCHWARGVIAATRQCAEDAMRAARLRLEL